MDGVYLLVDLREVASVTLNAILLRSQFTMDLKFVEYSILIYNSRVNFNRVDLNRLDQFLVWRPRKLIICNPI